MQSSLDAHARLQISDPEFKEMLRDVFCATTERSAALLAETTAPDLLPHPSETLVLGTINFYGPLLGSLQMAVPVTLGVVIAANMLGNEQDHNAGAGYWRDALKNLLHQACVNALASLTGDPSPFTLGLPSLHAFSSGEWDAMCKDPACLTYCIEDQPLLLRMVALS